MTFSISELIFSYVPDREDLKNTIKLDQRAQPDQHSLRNKTLVKLLNFTTINLAFCIAFNNAMWFFPLCL